MHSSMMTSKASLAGSRLATAPRVARAVAAPVRANTIVATAEPATKVEMPKYCESTTRTARRKTSTVTVGDVKIGSEHPITLQTMTTTDTRDVEGTVAQVKKCADMGADMVRITVQGMQEAKACAKIKEQLLADGYTTPLVADIHFQPKVAMLVAESFDKIRVNPGNFADGTKKFDEINYDDPAVFEAERAEIREKFLPLALKCKELNRAMRIGTNHGSLSARILSFYGDTPRGMVESAFEFAEICREIDYHNFLFSMKASNPLVMVQAYRLLAEEMYKRGWDYPMHLGVTEAGEGEDGRMKSAIGIGALLQDGLGDTIRVSLTEDPELEMAPCGTLARMAGEQLGKGVEDFEETARDVHLFKRRVGDLPEQRESDSAWDYRNMLHRDGTVYSAVTLDDLENPEQLYVKLGAKLAVGMPFRDIATSDAIFMKELPVSGDVEGRTALRRLQEVGVHVITPLAELIANPLDGAVALVPAADAGNVTLPECSTRFMVSVDGTESKETLAALTSTSADCLIYSPAADVPRVQAGRFFFNALAEAGCTKPVIHHIVHPAGVDKDEVILRTGSEVGGLLVDGLGDGAMVEAVDAAAYDVDFCRTTAFGMLQGCRMRNIKTEYVSCPSCGRTLFDLQEVTAQISEATGHLPGVTIAVMGCIVNGPGEMADADFGYVGGAPGKIDLYVNKDVVRRGIPMEGACEELIDLIKEHGRWQDKEPAEEPAEVAA